MFKHPKLFQVPLHTTTNQPPLVQRAGIAHHLHTPAVHLLYLVSQPAVVELARSVASGDWYCCLISECSLHNHYFRTTYVQSHSEGKQVYCEWPAANKQHEQLLLLSHTYWYAAKHYNHEPSKQELMCMWCTSAWRTYSLKLFIPDDDVDDQIGPLSPRSPAEQPHFFFISQLPTPYMAILSFRNI